MIRAKKSLGQNFLIDDRILSQIVSCVEIKNKNILEIGPGTGNLSKYILKKKPKKFTVVEKDSDLASYLKDQLRSFELTITYILPGSEIDAKPVCPRL